MNAESLRPSESAIACMAMYSSPVKSVTTRIEWSAMCTAFSSYNLTTGKRYGLFLLRKPVDKRLHSHHTGIHAIPVCDLSRQGTSYAALSRYALPFRRRDAAQVSAQRVDDWFVCHADYSNPIFGNRYRFWDYLIGRVLA